MTTPNHSIEIRDFVVNNFLFGDAGSLQNDTSFLDSGTLDSTGVLEFVTFLESTFQIKVKAEEMVPENLDSISRASAFVARKCEEKGALKT